MEKLIVFIISIFLISCSSDAIEPKNDDEVQRSYTKMISRISSDSYEDSLIFEAEKIYPIRDSVLAVVDSNYHQFIPETDYWYYNSFDGIKLPFAITTDAIGYYSSLIDSLNGGNIYQFIIVAEFEYSANISFYEHYVFNEIDPYTFEQLPPVSFDKVYVIEMSLKWYHYCAPECALWIDHKRIVIFDEKGNLLIVFFDGISPVAVS